MTLLVRLVILDDRVLPEAGPGFQDLLIREPGPVAGHERRHLVHVPAALSVAVLEKMADVTIVTDAVASLHEDWFGVESVKHDRRQLQIAADRTDAIAMAVAMAGEGDVVVIAGSRTPTEFTFGAADAADADIARELLYAASRTTLRLVG